VKLITWCGDSLHRIREFPEAARRKVGQQLNRLQHGLEPHDWKPMPSVGAGACEIRVHAIDEHRVIYVAKFADAIYVLHAFAKKSQKAPKRDLTIASARLRALVEARKRPNP
jgi:phage-related protein